MTAVVLRLGVCARRAGAPTARATEGGAGTAPAGMAGALSGTSSSTGWRTDGDAGRGDRFLGRFGRRCVFLFGTVTLAPGCKVPDLLPGHYMSSGLDRRIIHAAGARAAGILRTTFPCWLESMNYLGLTYNHTTLALAITIIALLAIFTGGVLLMFRRMHRLETRFDTLFENVSEDSVTRMLTEYLSTVRGTAALMQRIKTEHDQIARVVPHTIQHVGLIRFSPFHDTGGDQSFALALLDGQRDGVIVTGLHSRTESRLYAKPVERGVSRYTLTPEEREAMDRALGEVAVAASWGD